MTDQELDQLMRRVLLDVAAKNEQKENQYKNSMRQDNTSMKFRKC